MIAILYYLLKVLIGSVILFGYYLLVLKDKPFHFYNRYYLLTAAVASWLIPLLKIDITSHVAYAQTPVIQYAKIVAENNSDYENVVIQQNHFFQWDQILIFISLMISGIILISFLYSLGKIFMILKKFSIQSYQDIKLVNTDIKGTPFSFFQYIFWHKDIDLLSRSGQQMMTHELVHVREKHSADKVFMELMMVIGWFNPIFWMMKKELYIIHEFIADNKSIANRDTSLLAEMLLLAAYPNQANRLSNPFFFSPIKRRINMLSKTTTRFTYLRRLMILPILSFVIMLLAFRYVQREEVRSIVPLKKTYTIIIDAGHGGDDTGIKVSSGETEKDLALAMVKRIKELNQNANIQIILNRENDVFIPVNKRHDRTLKEHADLFVSIHINAAAMSATRQIKKSGMEIYIPDSISTYHQHSIQLANSINQACEGIFQSNIIGIRKQTIWVLKTAPCPAVLIETGYMTNPQDLKTMKERQDEIARKVLSGIEIYLKSTE